jgi:hypothetical protein
LIFGGQTGLSVMSHKRSMELFAQMSKSFPVRDMGGRGYPGQPVVINPSAGPEVFVPSTAGKFTPNVKLGEQHNHFSFMINTPSGQVSRATQQQIGAAAARGVADAARRNN